MAVVIEHGTFGSRAAAPIARDIVTYLYDPQAAIDTLHRLETEWNGTPQQRMQRRYAEYAAAAGVTLPPELPANLVPTTSPVDAESFRPVPSRTPAAQPTTAPTDAPRDGR